MLSVIIPTLDAAKVLGQCLTALRGADEILVVDGGSIDASRGIAAQAGAKVALAPRGRGAQLQAGAKAASGDWLLFLHADTVLRPGWLDAVEQHIVSFPDCAGYFCFRLDDPAWQARWIERGVGVRSGAFGLPYGDQGLLISRALYAATGGYRPFALMEDVDLVRRLGRGRLRALGATAVTSAARWRRDGWLRRSARNLLCLGSYFLGVSPDRLARLYR